MKIRRDDKDNDWFFEILDGYTVTSVDRTGSIVRDGRHEVSLHVSAISNKPIGVERPTLEAEIALLKERVHRLESEDIGKKLIERLRKDGDCDEDDWDE